jgi:hypothetical protein
MIDDRHPEELLASYAEDTLPDGERATVETHLSTCARCREETSLALRAIEAVRTLPDEPVPLGVTRPVLEEVRVRAARTKPRPLSQRVLWAAGGAVAAAFIGLVAIWVLPGVGSSANDSAGGTAEVAQAPTVGGGAGNASGPQAARVTLEHRSTDYDDAALRRLAESTAVAARGRVLGAPADEASTAGETRTAAACLDKGAGTEPRDVLVRLISATYSGEPALIGVYLTGASAEQPAKSVLIWVVRPNTCEFASITQDRI